MSATVHGPRRRCTPRFSYDPDVLPRPRAFGYIDVWRGGSLVDFGVEVATKLGCCDPAFEISIQFEAAPNSVTDRLLCMLTGVRR